MSDVRTVSVPAPRRPDVGPSAPPPPDPARRIRAGGIGASSWPYALAGVLGAAVVTALGFRGLGDDSYISLDYARTLVEHGQWGLVPGRTTNTATSPLNIALLAVGYAVTGTATGAVGSVLAATFAVLGASAHRLALALGLGPTLPLATLGLMASSPLLASTLGMETYLGATVVVALAAALVRDRVVVAGLLCGLAVLVRPDTAVPAAVVVLVLLRGPGVLGRLRRAGVIAGLGVLVALPWHLWAWFALGGFVPDTFAFKTNPAAGRVPSLIAEFDDLFWSRTPTAVAVTGAVVVAGWICALVAVAGLARAPRPERTALRRRVVVAAAASGTAHVGALMVVNAYPQAWYWGPLVAGAGLAVALTAAAHASRAMTGALGLTVAVSVVVAGQGGVPWRSAEMNSNFTDAGHYLAIGRDLPALVGTAPVSPPGEVGALLWACRCDLVDQFTSQQQAQGLLERRHELGGHLSRAILDANRLHRADAPAIAPAYQLRYVRSGEAEPAGVLATWWVRSPQTGATFRVVLARA